MKEDTVDDDTEGEGFILSWDLASLILLLGRIRVSLSVCAKIVGDSMIAADTGGEMNRPLIL